MRRLLAKAASAPADEVIEVLAGADLSTVSKPTLTSAAIALEPIDRFVGDRTSLGIFSLAEWEDGRPHGECFQEISVGEDGSGQRVQGRSSSLLWTDTITSIEMCNEGDRITGEVSFASPGCFRGRLPFEARRGFFGWRIVGFDLPGAGARTVLGDDGKWEVEQPEWVPIPDLRCRRFLAPIHVRIRSEEAFTWFEVEGQPVSLEEMVDWVRERSVSILWDQDASFLSAKEFLGVLEAAEVSAEVIFFVTRRSMGSCWPVLGPGFAVPPDVNRKRGWVTVPQRVWRGRLGRGPMPRLWLEADEILGSPSGQPARGVSQGQGVVDFTRAVLESVPNSAFVVSANDDVQVGQVDELFDAIQVGGGRKILLLVDQTSGLLFQIKDPVGPMQ